MSRQRNTQSNPYDIIGVARGCADETIRMTYRDRLLEFKYDRLRAPQERQKSPSDYQLLCRAYETLTNPKKKQIFNETGRWTSFLPIENYTLQQLAADPYLIDQLDERLRRATLLEINAQDPETGHTPLYVAARVCNADAIIFLTEQDAELDSRQKYGGSTALHAAAFYGHIEVVERLLENGADYTLKNDYGHTAEKEMNENSRWIFSKMREDPYVQTAANQLDWLRRHWNQSEHIDFQYHSLGQTLLHCAAKKGHFHLVRWLIEEQGANRDIIDINLRSALHLAAHKGHERIVEYLLDCEADSNLINKWGMTAEQEGLPYENRITRVFDQIRNRDMFQMAADGKQHWFEFHFDMRKIDDMSEKGNTVLYLACRNGHTALANWLLNAGASINKRQKETKSTPLHGAVFYDRFDVVELLIAYGADMNIRNSINETPFDNAQSAEMKNLLEKYRDDLREEKVISVHLYGDGLSSGNKPLTKFSIGWDTDLQELRRITKAKLGDKFDGFTIARRPLHTEGDHLTVVSALYRARHGDTKFIELPICLTVHERRRYMNSGHVMRSEPARITHRDFDGRIKSVSQEGKLKIRGDINDSEVFKVGDIKLSFQPYSTTKSVSVKINYIGSVDSTKFNLPGGVCLFQLNSESRKDRFVEMPTVTYEPDSRARLYTWIPSTGLWFGSSTTSRLPIIDGIHGFVRHIEIFPPHLTLPNDIFISKSLNKPLRRSERPVPCKRLQIREQDVKNFPHTAYHGTKIEVIRSILMDGFVMPSTVVSNGFRVCPPDNHIARGKSNFGIDDFANAIFISPSIHYCSDPVYARTFQVGDEILIPIIECAVKSNRYGSFPSTVPGYKPHPDDDIKKIEWRLDNPGDIQVTAIVFIETIKSRSRAAKYRALNIGVDAVTLASSYRKFI